VKIECAYKELWPIERLKENPRNPNTHPQKQIDLLAKIIRETGWRSPIVVSARSGYVVKGHGRLLAARAAGFTEVPVDVQAYESDAQELADLVADNEISALSEIDQDVMESILADECFENFDTDLLAIPDAAETMKALRASFSSEDAARLEISDSLAGDDFLDQMNAPIKPKLPITPIYCEHHQAFVIVCDNKIDEGFIREKLGLTEKRKSYADVKFVIPNVINAKEVIEKWK
jgi:hypothetical protein